MNNFMHAGQVPQQIRIANIVLPVPKFDQKNSTASEFLDEVEAYFAAQNYHPDQYLYLLPAVLPTDANIWWKRNKPGIFDWEEFKLAFLNRYQSISDVNHK